MVRIRVMIGAAAGFVFAAGSALATEWTLRQRVDAMSDQKITTALTREEGGSGSPKMLIVECAERWVAVVVMFRDYLGDSSIKVRVRVDKQGIQHLYGTLSKSGTDIAIGDSDMARNLATGARFVVEATDFRGVVHLAEFSLEGARPKIAEVLKQCGSAPPAAE